MKQSKWDQRIQRADQLATAHPFAAEVLTFYRHLAEFQKMLYFSLQAINGNAPAKSISSLFDEELNLELLLPAFPEFLSHVEAASPAPIVQAAGRLKKQPSGRRAELLSFCWQNAPDFQITGEDPESLLAYAFLQPYAEFCADHAKPANHDEAIAVCPFCGSKPVVGVLRPEGDGAKRSLICSLCLTEWKYGRIRCPACGEEVVEKLAVYTAEQFPHVRVEACDSCHNYIKTVDLSKNGLAVPIVDELATIPLNLWAKEHQYEKLRANLLGI